MMLLLVLGSTGKRHQLGREGAIRLWGGVKKQCVIKSGILDNQMENTGI